MSDAFRQTPGEKIHDAVKPDAQKTWTEKKGDQISGTLDKGASHAQPEHNKSATQKIIDSVTPGNDAHTTTSHDVGRRDPLSSAQAALTLDSHKSTGTYTKDQVLGHGDNAAAHVQPNSQKSVGQKITDAVTPGSTNHSVEDHTRRDAHDTAGAKLKPDAFKTQGEINHDHAAGVADKKAAQHTDPNHKSVGQKIKDVLTHPKEALTPSHRTTTTGTSGTHHA